MKEIMLETGRQLSQRVKDVKHDVGHWLDLVTWFCKH